MTFLFCKASGASDEEGEDNVDVAASGAVPGGAAASQRSRAAAWHFGQCRLRQEL